MRWFLAGLMFLGFSALGQAAPSPRSSLEVFKQAQARLLADTARMPHYSCEQNILRHFYRSDSEEVQSCAQILARRDRRKRGPGATSWDRLQLDVTVADQGEIHSWPGAAKFDEDEIRRLVSNGPFGSGDFSAFVAGIFGGSATIKFIGQRNLAGRSLFDYSFTVSSKASRYRVASSDGELITAYEGSFLLDPQTGDLSQLAVRTAELPEATSACQAMSEIEYRRQDIHGHQVLIPKQTDLRMVYRDGREAAASTSYSSCHEYTSKSVLHFDNADLGTANPSATPVSYSAPPSPLPPGLKFNCRVVTPINSDTAAGRPIEAILRSPIRAKDKTVLVPAGARIHGRLVRLAEHLRPLDYFEVGIRFESIEMNGAERPLYAGRAELAALPFGPAEWGGVDGKTQLAELPARAPRSVGIFFFVREHLHLAQFDSQWITTPPESLNTAHPTPAQKPAELEKQNLSGEVNNLVLAIKDSQKAIELQNASPASNAGNLCDIPNLQDVLAYRRKAIAEGKAADKDALNKIYPELGNRFQSEFVESLSSFVRGCAMTSQLAGTSGQEVTQSMSLAQDWADWYEAHRKAIQDSINQRPPASEGLTASSAPFEPERGLPSALPAQPAVQEQAVASIQDAPAQKAPSDSVPVPNPKTQQAAHSAGASAASETSASGAPASGTPVSANTNHATTMPAAGAAISAELSKSVDARKNKVGDKVEARITQQSILPGKVVLPRDTKIMGHVSKVKANSKDSPGSMVEITFDEALLHNSKELPLQMTLQAIGKPVPIEAATIDSSLTKGGDAAPTGPSSSGNSHNTANEAPREAPTQSNPDAAANIPGEDGSRSTLNAKSEGVIGIDGLALSASEQASTISSAKGNVHLDKGTQLILRTL